MYQPPLYYLIGAAILSACKLSINDPASVAVLRVLGAFFGIAQCVLVFLTLRLLLPVRAALIGLLLAAFLPMHLYLAHYVTNEILAATLATLTIYLCLRVLKNETPRAATICLRRIGTWRDDADKGDRYPATPHRNRCDLRARHIHTRAPIAICVAQSRARSSQLVSLYAAGIMRAYG